LANFECVRLGEEPATAQAPAKDFLKDDETIINPYYMRQLLEYGVKLAKTIDPGDPNSSEKLLYEAEVGPILVGWVKVALINTFYLQRLVQELKALQLQQ
jgi:hypothetical protein